MYFKKYGFLLFLLIAMFQQPCQTTPAQKEWCTIFDEAKKSVIQIFSYQGTYDIFRPYKTPSHQLMCGSGFFIADDGYLLTNFHVIDKALAIFIQIPELGKERFAVEIVGVHPERDLALLKLPENEHLRLKKSLNVEKLPHLTMAENSDNLKETQEITLVGYPLGDENIKASLGECSGREYSPGYGNMIQTTVPSNCGNSGGPYLDKNGEVVGVCAYGIVGLGVEGVNYFIPSNTVKTVLPDLYKKVIVANPFWGVEPIPTTEHTNKYLNAPQDGGFYITEIKEGSISAESEFKKGDIVYRVNDLAIDHYGCVKIASMDTKIDISDYLSRFPLGTQHVFEIYRDGTQMILSTTTKEPDLFKTKPFYPYLQAPLDFEVIGGLVVVQLATNHLEAVKKNVPAVSKYLKAKELVKAHVIITDILPSSAAARTRCFGGGDWFISKINGIPVATIQDFRDAIIAGKEREHITIETDEGSLVALSIDEILQQENLLAQQFGYPKSKLIDVLAASRA